MLCHPDTGKPVSRLPRGSAIVDSGGAPLVVLEGVPLLVADAVATAARAKDAIVTAVARCGGDVRAALAVVDACAAALPSPVAPDPFVPDATAAELDDAPPPVLRDAEVGALVDDADSPTAWIAARTPRADVIVDVGPGAGALSTLVAARARRRLLVADAALPLTLLARTRARAALAASRASVVVGAVLDACALALADASVDVILADNVVDATASPRAMIAECARVLRPGGSLILTTPRPHLHELGAASSDAPLRDALASAGLSIDEWRDGLRWARVHGDRHVELWCCVGLVATKRRARPTSRPVSRSTTSA